jgi:hypothetical protein
MIIERISAEMTRTIESMIITGDTELWATGNVNSDDQLPVTTFGTASHHTLLLDNGIRKVFLSGTANVDYKDIGTL